MFKELEILSAAQVAELRGIAASAKFVDGRISNPHSTVKQNLQLHDEAAYTRSSQILTQALYAHEDFQNFAFPIAMLPPMMARYTNEMRYGAHADAAFLQLGAMSLRSDLSATIFLADPASHFLAIARHFGVESDQATARAICTGPLIGRYSKALEYEYTPATRREILAEARWQHGPAIRDALGWLNDLAARYPAVAGAIRRSQGG